MILPKGQLWIPWNANVSGEAKDETEIKKNI